MEDKKIVTETDMMRAESVSGGTSSPCDENISGKSANGSQLIVGVNEKISWECSMYCQWIFTLCR